MKITGGDVLASLLWIAMVAGCFWLLGEVYGWWDWWRAVL